MILISSSILTRFAEFVAGDSHLSQNEISLYDTDLSLLDDDNEQDSDSSISLSEVLQGDRVR